MALNKSPGSDGFQANFYIMFWNKLGTFLMDAFNYALETGCLHQSARTGIISLIPKKGRDTRYIKTW